MAACHYCVSETTGDPENGAGVEEAPGGEGKAMSKPPLAYENEDFLKTSEARSVRILSEYLEPLSHFRRQRIRDTVVFFGSARLRQEGPMGRYYEEARQLAKMVTEWSESYSTQGHRFVVCSGGGP